ncbi:MAG TPA: hypothetical protein VLA16_05520 [Ideonella sp.]|nr:hypothetical protein [Ideonella sp.]
MAETMLLRMPAAMLLGALLGWWAARRVAPAWGALFSVAALVLASFVMPFWMLPVMMDKAAAEPAYCAARDASLALAGAGAALCFEHWSPLLRHLWVLEQVGMLLRYAVWYGMAPVALCTAWDAGPQRTVGWGLLAGAAVLAGGYLALCLRVRGLDASLEARAGRAVWVGRRGRRSFTDT